MKTSKILVWDLPVRVFHWLLALSFAGAFLTAESERYRDVHVALGYTMLGLIAFRLLWAFAGSRYARLSSFAFGPRAVIAYLSSFATGRPAHYVGHNPAGSWAIYATVVLALVTGASGYAVYVAGDGSLAGSLHEAAANAMLALVIVHIAGVAVSSLLHRENLVRAMITGYKSGNPGDGIAKSRWPAAVALVCLVAVIWSAALDVSGPSVAAASAGAQRSEPARDKHGDATHARAAHADDNDDD